VISNLFSYTITHFRTEEELFEKYAYPTASFHKKEHKKFVRRIQEFKDAFDGGRLGVSIQVMNFLRDWLKHHIMEVDKRYSVFFTQHGLE